MSQDNNFFTELIILLKYRNGILLTFGNFISNTERLLRDSVTLPAFALTQLADIRFKI